MPTPSIDAPEALDAAIAACRQARREKLLRAVRNQRIRTWIACSGLMGFCALMVFVFAGDYKAAGIIAMIACCSLGFSYLTATAGLRKTVESLRETDPLA